MPLSVFVRSAAGDEPPPLTFDGERVVLGRGAFADVRLPDPSVSARHATLRAAAGEYVLVDEGSTNGTFVGGIRLTPQTPRTVRSGDLVRLGRVWVEVRTEPAPLTHDLPLATRDLAFGLVAQAMQAMGDDTTARVTVVEGADVGATLSLAEDGHVYVIGRGDGCALLLADEGASREHVQIIRRGGSVLVRDLGAKNRAALGDAWLSSDRDVLWRRPAMLRVGHTVLSLSEPVADALAELEAAADEPLPDTGAPPPPPPSSRADGPASLHAAHVNAAPVVAAPPAVRTKPPPPRLGWTATDVGVAGASVLVIALSALGLYWLFRG